MSKRVCGRGIPLEKLIALPYSAVFNGEGANWLKPFSQKSWEFVVTRWVSRAVNASKCVCGRGSTPDTSREAYSADRTFVVLFTEVV